MQSSGIRTRLLYGAAFCILLAVEVYIALFVRDSFIRPYGGDILVTVLICCFLRVFLPEKPHLLPVFVFLFAAAVEVGQYFDFVSRIGLGGSRFFRILLGSTFSPADILCYLTGCILFTAAERFCRRHKTDHS